MCLKTYGTGLVSVYSDGSTVACRVSKDPTLETRICTDRNLFFHSSINAISIENAKEMIDRTHEGGTLIGFTDH